jgi:hypothetical protein
MNWIAAMLLDARLTARDKNILTRLVMHLNLKTGRCDPSIGLLALELSIGGNDESAIRVVRRSLERSEKLGWVRRIFRSGGDVKYRNQSNAYHLTIPPDVYGAGAGGQNRQSGRTKQGGARGLRSPPNCEGRIRKEEYSVSSIRPLSKKADNGAVDLDSIQFVVDFLVLEDRPKSLAGIIAYSNRMGQTVSTQDILAMEANGYLRKTPAGAFELGPKAAELTN